MRTVTRVSGGRVAAGHVVLHQAHSVTRRKLASLGCAAAAELLSTLHMCYDSLTSTGDAHIANSLLLDVLRQVRSFVGASCGRTANVHGP